MLSHVSGPKRRTLKSISAACVARPWFVKNGFASPFNSISAPVSAPCEDDISGGLASFGSFRSRAVGKYSRLSRRISFSRSRCSTFRYL